MNKPITLVYEEFKQELANIINNSGLPPMMIEPVLQNYLAETRAMMQSQYQRDKAAYEESLRAKDSE